MRVRDAAGCPRPLRRGTYLNIRQSSSTMRHLAPCGLPASEVIAHVPRTPVRLTRIQITDERGNRREPIVFP
ncbi:hypothetical protein VTK73DRAFT_9314 [Phialemonium thermophilum]|uniref:Uncharacterized protein n=1 Tax=Phialemonium thermophilum TaxID=223376 RepID=A0ABR3W368_9PEZI